MVIFVNFLKKMMLNNHDFNNAKIYKIYKDINDVIYIGSTCFSLKNVCRILKLNINQGTCIHVKS